MKLPNLFLAGFARCGTTHLHSILCQHPDVHTWSWKEPNFFNWPYQGVSNPLAYFKLFDSPKRCRMDSSPTYLANPQTARILRALFPDAKYLVMLRDPKARAYSLFQLMRQWQGEDIPNFADALKAEAARASSHEFAATCMLETWLYLYTRSTLYDEHLRRYFATIERDRFYILSLAELSKQPIATTESILKFLDLDPGRAKTFDFGNRGFTSASVDAPPYDMESDQIMSAAFDGLTKRTDELVGRSVDWSL